MNASHVQVLLPLKLGWIPLYRSSRPLDRGRIVEVAFSGRRYSGVVWKTGCTPDIPEKRIVDIIRTREDLPIIGEQELRLWKFISSYYLCTPGEVFKAAYPSLRIQGENACAARAARLRGKVSRLEAQLQGRHCERVEQRLRKELEGVRAELSGIEGRPSSPPSGKASAGETLTREIPAGEVPAGKASAPKPLLVKGSGRLARYRELIAEALGRNMQVLVLAPEISFCERTADSLEESFGHCLYRINADRSPSQRQRVSQLLRSGAKAVVVGTRSAVFLPFSRLGLVIIDEEQDSSYKQDEPAPRYNARDTGIYLASLHGAAAVLGSAFPSLESELNCRSGKYLVEQTGHSPAAAAYIDIIAERRKNGMQGPVSRKLAAEIRSAGCKALLIRGWEDKAALETQVRGLFPGQEVIICSLPELKREGPRGAGLIAVLQIEAFCQGDDFRGDEKAMQLAAMLGSLAPRVIIQTSTISRFVPGRSADALLEERREFSFPPYTRLVELRRYGDRSVQRRFFLPKDAALPERKLEIAASVPEDCYADVDPM